MRQLGEAFLGIPGTTLRPSPTTARTSFDALVNANLAVCTNSGFCYLAAALSRNVVLVNGDTRNSNYFTEQLQLLHADLNLDNVVKSVHDHEGAIQSDATARALNALLSANRGRATWMAPGSSGLRGGA